MKTVATAVVLVVCGYVVCRLIGAAMIRDIRASSARAAALTLTSAAFRDGGDIPAKYTGAGENISPPLNWGEPPAGAKSLALVVVDEGTPIGLPLTHWVVFNIPASAPGLDEGITSQDGASAGMVQGLNWSRSNAFVGPEPPWGRHLYSFTLYALDIELDLGPATNRLSLMRAMKGHVLAAARLTGYYARGQ